MVVSLSFGESVSGLLSGSDSEEPPSSKWPMLRAMVWVEVSVGVNSCCSGSSLIVWGLVCGVVCLGFGFGFGFGFVDDVPSC